MRHLGTVIYEYHVFQEDRLVVVTGLDGRIVQTFSDAFTRYWRDVVPENIGKSSPFRDEQRRRQHMAEASRCMTSFIWMLNLVHASRDPRENRRPVHEMFGASIEDCRWILRRFVYLLGLEMKEDRRTRSSFWVKAPVQNARKFQSALWMAKRVAGFLQERGHYNGENPCKVEVRFSRTNGEQGILVTKRKLGRDAAPSRVRLDVDNWIRVDTRDLNVMLDVDPRCCDQIAEGLKKISAPASHTATIKFQGKSGCRISSALNMTLYDKFVRAKQENLYPAPCKNDGRRRDLHLVLKVDSETHEDVLRYIDGERKAVSGLGLEDIRRMAADPVLRHRLKHMPLFTEDGIEPIPYHRIWRSLRKAAVAMDLSFEDRRRQAGGLPRKRYVSSHIQRHCYVYRWLEYAYFVSSETASSLAALEIVMGWKPGGGMVDRYSVHFKRLNGLIQLDKFLAEEDRNVAEVLERDDTGTSWEAVHDRLHALA